MITPKFFFAASEIVVTGRDYEAADFDNPEGHLFGVAAYVVAEDEDGRRVRLHVKTARHEDEAMLAAENLATKLTNRLNLHGKLPVGFSQWEHMEPRYGSEAYIIDRCEEERKEEERLASEDLYR